MLGEDFELLEAIPAIHTPRVEAPEKILPISQTSIPRHLPWWPSLKVQMRAFK